MNREKTLPSVQAVIVTWNKKADVLSLLSQLKSIRYPADRLSVLVVDNASTDGTARAIAAGHPDTTLIEHRRNRGGAGGFNAGMRWTLANRPQTDYLWLLDNDVRLDPDALIELVRVMESHPRAGICGSRIMDRDDRGQLIELGAFIDYRRGDVRRNEPDPDRRKDPNAIFKVDYVAACSLLARVERVKQLGIWHERFFIYWDDMEWGARFNAAGADVLAANGSVVYHPSWAGRTADQSAVWRNYYRTRNSLWFFNHYGSGFFKRMLLGKMVIRYLMFAVHAAISANGDLSQAFIQGVDDFLNDDFGRKRFVSKPVSLFATIEAETITDLMVFVDDASAAVNARSLVDDIAARYPTVRIRCILPQQARHAWPGADSGADRLFYTRTKAGRISLSDRYKIFRFLSAHPWQIFVSGSQAPKLATLWRRPVARMDYVTKTTLFIDTMILKDIFRILLRWPGLMIRSVLFTQTPYHSKEPLRRGRSVQS